jgi:hypothetical protein
MGIQKLQIDRPGTAAQWLSDTLRGPNDKQQTDQLFLYYYYYYYLIL